MQIQTALLAQLSGRPVSLVVSRQESLRISTKRHPFELRYTLGCDAAGKLTALSAELIADTGAYASVGAKVVERAAGHACGAYAVPHVRVTARCVYTNNPPAGAMRGFGVNQVTFAVEQLIDRLAEKVGIDRYTIRERNLLREGDAFGAGQRLRHCGGLLGALRAVKESFYGSEVAGIACGIKNVGIGHGVADRGRVRVDVHPGGKLVLHHGMTEMGQGLHTVALQMLAEGAGISCGADMAAEVCTDAELDCGMTTASRATVLIGHAAVDAGAKLARALVEVGGDLGALAGASFHGGYCCDWTEAPEAAREDPRTHLSFGFAAQVVILDPASGKVRKVVAAHDVGRAINPSLCEGQLQGSVHMGLGYALSEELRIEGGRPVATKLRELGVLRAHQTPEIEIILLEEPEPLGPFGARGVGEIGLVPTAPAVASALHAYDGKRRTRLPMADHYEKARPGR